MHLQGSTTLHSKRQSSQLSLYQRGSSSEAKIPQSDIEDTFTLVHFSLRLSYAPEEIKTKKCNSMCLIIKQDSIMLVGAKKYISIFVDLLLFYVSSYEIF